MDKRDILNKHLEAFAKGDWNTYKSFFTDDAIYEEEATRRVAKGPDDITKANQAWRKAFPDLKANVKNVVAAGDAVVVELEWEGTHKGQLDLPTGPVAATNRHGKVLAVEVVRFDGDKIREIRHYFDLMTILAQIGVGPKGAQPPAP